MRGTMRITMKITKVFNNNVVLATRQGPDHAAGGGAADVVLMGRGLGFGARPGDVVDPARVERTFRPGGGQTPERIAALLAEIPAEHLAVAEQVVQEARAVLGEHVAWHVLLPLADHISFAVRRAAEGVAIAYPLRGEVLHLYPQEVAVGRRAVAIIAERLEVTLPDLEAIPLALHLVNAQLDAGDLTRVMEMTEAFALVLGEVGTFYGVALDEDHLDVARFVTHLRYLARRQERGDLRPDALGDLHLAFRASHPRELQCAERVGDLLRERFQWVVGLDEVLFLALHIGRLAVAAGLR